MKYTSAEASKLLKTLNEQRDLLLRDELNCREFKCAVGEAIEDVKPEYDFSRTQDALDAVEAKIRTVKHAINHFNVQTVVPGFSMTIDQMLIYIPQLTAKKAKLMEMQSKQPKARNEFLTLKNGVIDYIYANYKIEDAKQAYLAVSEELSKAQLALDAVNCTETMEIEL